MWGRQRPGKTGAGAAICAALLVSTSTGAALAADHHDGPTTTGAPVVAAAPAPSAAATHASAEQDFPHPRTLGPAAERTVSPAGHPAGPAPAVTHPAATGHTSTQARPGSATAAHASPRATAPRPATSTPTRHQRTATVSPVSGWDATLLALVNRARAAAGLAPVHLTSALDRDAVNWSATMAAAADLHHDANIRAEANRSCPAWTVIGENVGYSPDVTTLFDAYMKSPKHRANILERRYTGIGLGTVRASNGTLWNTMRFAAGC